MNRENLDKLDHQIERLRKQIQRRNYALECLDLLQAGWPTVTATYLRSCGWDISLERVENGRRVQPTTLLGTLFSFRDLAGAVIDQFELLQRQAQFDENFKGINYRKLPPPPSKLHDILG